MAKVSEAFAKVRGGFDQAQIRLQGQPPVIADLARQHGEIDTLMQRLLNASANTLREPVKDNPAEALYASVRNKLLDLVNVHEPGLYARVSREELRPLLARAQERHRQLREVLTRLERPSADRVRWDEELRQLSLIFRQHVREQREELFPQWQHSQPEGSEQASRGQGVPGDGN